MFFFEMVEFVKLCRHRIFSFDTEGRHYFLVKYNHPYWARNAFLGVFPCEPARQLKVSGNYLIFGPE